MSVAAGKFMQQLHIRLIIHIWKKTFVSFLEPEQAYFDAGEGRVGGSG